MQFTREQLRNDFSLLYGYSFKNENSGPIYTVIPPNASNHYLIDNKGRSYKDSIDNIIDHYVQYTKDWFKSQSTSCLICKDKTNCLTCEHAE